MNQSPVVSLPHPLVVHCKRDPFDIYVGRTPNGAQKWGNPFSWKEGTLAEFLVSKEECLPRYIEWVNAQPALLARIRERLPAKRLGCWCRPVGGFQGRLLCHGQVLAGIANGIPFHEVD